jgi:nucleoside-diphosphate kinase
MPVERTLSIIKPDAVARNIIGDIYRRFEQAGLKIVAARMMRMSVEEAGRFYAVHSQKFFFERLVNFMSSGPIMVQVLEGEDAISLNRSLMGATNPKKADPGTIRRDFAVELPDEELHQNMVHGSDSGEAANEEIAFFFKPDEVFSPRG